MSKITWLVLTFGNYKTTKWCLISYKGIFPERVIKFSEGNIYRAVAENSNNAHPAF